jgi:hypothetical protein
MIWRPTVIEGFSVSNGFWNTICTSETSGVAFLDRVSSISLVVEQDLAVGRRLQPHQHLGEGGLAAAGFAHDGQRLALARLEGSGSRWP